MELSRKEIRKEELVVLQLYSVRGCVRSFEKITGRGGANSV